MTPRLVIIFAFAFACMVIVSGAIIGAKHASTSRHASVAPASNSADTASTPPDDATRQTSPQPDATPAEPPGQDSTRSGSTTPEPIKPDSAQQGALPPSEPTGPNTTQQNAPSPKAAPQDVARPEPAHPETDQQGSADPLPIIVTYELKKHRDTARIIARDPKAFWIRQIVAKIEDKKVDLAKPLGQPVVVQLEFVVGRDGTLLSKSVSKSSSSDEADKAAIAMLERAQPFPPMPESLRDQEMTFSLPVRFH